MENTKYSRASVDCQLSALFNSTLFKAVLLGVESRMIRLSTTLSNSPCSMNLDDHASNSWSLKSRLCHQIVGPRTFTFPTSSDELHGWTQYSSYQVLRLSSLCIIELMTGHLFDRQTPSLYDDGQSLQAHNLLTIRALLFSTSVSHKQQSHHGTICRATHFPES